VLIVGGAAVIGVLLEAFLPRATRRSVQVPFALVALAAGLVAVVWRFAVVHDSGPRHGVTGGGYLEDLPGIAIQAVLLVVALLGLLVIADRTQTGDGAFAAQAASRPGSADEDGAVRAGFVQTEIYPLVLFSVTGMMVFPAAGDLITLFVALEVLSLPLYVLTATARRRRLLSQEAAMKYFILGAFASAFFLFGIALLYGFSGSLNLSEIAAAVPTTTGLDSLLLPGVFLVLVGLLFKVGAVPFHAWTPDVYTGAPTPVTGFMAAATKIAAFGAMLRFIYVVASGLQWDLGPVLWTIAIITMLLGTVIGLIQTDIKRMLAYSSIAHAGFVLIGVFSLVPGGVGGTIFYLLAYGLATIGAFALVTLVREKDSTGAVTGEATSINQWRGIGRTRPLLAVSMLLFMMSFAGIPLTAGFVGKFSVFSAGIDGGAVPLVVIAILCSAATAFFYFRLVVLMFFSEPETESVTVVSSEGMTVVAVACCAIATIVLGVVPSPILELLASAAAFVL
jgi:NADH-quinone oxidoreductase subunit N